MWLQRKLQKCIKHDLKELHMKPLKNITRMTAVMKPSEHNSKEEDHIGPSPSSQMAVTSCHHFLLVSPALPIGVYRWNCTTSFCPMSTFPQATGKNQSSCQLALQRHNSILMQVATTLWGWVWFHFNLQLYKTAGSFTWDWNNHTK